MKTIARTAVRIITPMRMKLTQVGHISVTDTEVTVHAVDALRGPIEVVYPMDEFRYLWAAIKDLDRVGKLGTDD